MIDLILGGKSNALSVSRALACDDISSCLLDNHVKPIAASSKYIDKVFYYNNDIDCFLKTMSDAFGSSEKILYPTSDYWLEFITNNKDVLRQNGFLFFDNSTDLINTFIDKLSFYKKLSRRFSIPKTVDLNERIDGRYIVKPKRAFQQQECINKGFAQCESGVVPDDYLVKQSFIDVPLVQHYSVSGVAYQGEVKAAIITQKLLEHPSPGGTATMISTLEDEYICAQLSRLAEEVLSFTQYSGAYEIEILEAQGQFWLLEVNARFWLQHAMPLAEGLNFAGVYRRLLLGQDIGSDFSPYFFDEYKKLSWFHEGAPISFLKTSPSKKLEVIKTLFLHRSSVSFGYYSKGDIKPLIEFIKCCLLRK